MNKIAVYLNEHLLGEVSSATSLRRKYSTDGSVLAIAPEIIAFPRVTNDIRKIARFTWQLAEKGHIVGMTVRGLGGDTTGGAIGKGIVIDTSTYIRSIIQIIPKDKLLHVQPGARLSDIDQALKWQGMQLSGSLSRTLRDGTVAGSIAGASHGTSGSIAQYIQRMEVVLANGDLIETGRISRRDITKKLGLQTFEGEIYRKLEGLLEDNETLVEQIAADTTPDSTGYKRIAEVRQKDGSFDLTPLFIGSQGTLGILSEIVLKTEFYSRDETHAIITAESFQTARDVGEKLVELEPAELTILDGELFRRAAKTGSTFGLVGNVDQIGAVIYVRFNDFSDRLQATKLKKARKLITKLGIGIVDSTERSADEFATIYGIGEAISQGVTDEHISMPLINGAFIPANRREEFELSLNELASKHHIELPLSLNLLLGTYDFYPILKLTAVGDKQKLFKVLSEYATVVDRSGGAYTSDGAEGRLKAHAAWTVLDDEHAHLYDQIRTIFDPFGTLNPGVKQKGDLRTIVTALRPTYDAADATTRA